MLRLRKKPEPKSPSTFLTRMEMLFDALTRDVSIVLAADYNIDPMNTAHVVEIAELCVTSDLGRLSLHDLTIRRDGQFQALAQVKELVANLHAVDPLRFFNAPSVQHYELLKYLSMPVDARPVFVAGMSANLTEEQRRFYAYGLRREIQEAGGSIPDESRTLQTSNL